jgi:hypothetical protein
MSCNLATETPSQPISRILRPSTAGSASAKWGGLDSNQRPTDYESAALTN